MLGFAGEDAELLYDTGWAMNSAEAARMLGVEVDSVEAMLRDGQVLAVRLRGEVLLPNLQFVTEGDRAKTLAGIPAVVAAAVEAGAEGWHLLQWLVLPSEALRGRVPHEVLRAGKVDAVVSAARAEA